MTRWGKTSTPAAILTACFLTAYTAAAFADNSEEMLHEQLVHQQLLHEQLLLQQQLQQQLREQLKEMTAGQTPVPPAAQAAVVADSAPIPLAAAPQPVLAAVPPPVLPTALPPHRQQVEQAALAASPPGRPAVETFPPLVVSETPVPPAEPPVQETPPPETAPHAQPLPQQLGLDTHRGLDIGAQLSRYEYHEVVGGLPFVNNKGYKAGGELAYTEDVTDNNWFMRGEARLADGTVNYAGSGSSKNNTDYTWELRALAGKDYAPSNIGLTPYTGYGVRFLHNDARGLSSTGAAGYRRNSTYQYIPLGLTHRFMLAQQARLATNLEYDYFLVGHQRSILSDVFPGTITLKNTQRKAVGGFKGSVLYETAEWSVGPFFNYWHIKDSNVDCGPGFCGMEPDNKTTEIGFKIVKNIF